MHHRAKKSLGQHFLKSKKALSDMIAAGNVTSTDTVLEIGPGKGALTKELLQHAGKVIAIEKDKSLIPVLEETFAEEIATGKLKLIGGDVMEMGNSFLPLLKGEWPSTAEGVNPKSTP
jgi:16S rRNA (adenine1518-N6/adenine1519-N6)-dimethyltransferase